MTAPRPGCRSLRGPRDAGPRGIEGLASVQQRMCRRGRAAIFWARDSPPTTPAKSSASSRALVESVGDAVLVLVLVGAPVGVLEAVDQVRLARRTHRERRRRSGARSTLRRGRSRLRRRRAAAGRVRGLRGTAVRSGLARRRRPLSCARGAHRTPSVKRKLEAPSSGRSGPNGRPVPPLGLDGQVAAAQGRPPRSPAATRKARCTCCSRWELRSLDEGGLSHEIREHPGLEGDRDPLARQDVVPHAERRRSSVPMRAPSELRRRPQPRAHLGAGEEALAPPVGGEARHEHPGVLARELIGVSRRCAHLEARGRGRRAHGSSPDSRCATTHRRSRSACRAPRCP